MAWLVRLDMLLAGNRTHLHKPNLQSHVVTIKLFLFLMTSNALRYLQ